MKEYDVSVVVLTYHPDKQKLMQTLASIIMQKDIKLQIVVSDDGSPVDYFDFLEFWFKEIGFEDYKMVKNLQNAGTVKNVRNGLSACNGQYVKLISPGDFLAYETVLSQWIMFLRNSDSKWSFADAMYYYVEDGVFTPTKSVANPQVISCYQKKNPGKCRKNYLFNSDICLGAATLCERNVLTEYIELIHEKVVFAEDNAYRVMVRDDIIPEYFEKNVICYEFGSGISTAKNDKWKELLGRDWEATISIMKERGTDVRKNNKLSRVMYRIKKKYFTRKTSLTYDKDYIDKIYEMSGKLEVNNAGN